MNINTLRQAQDRIAEAIKALKKTRNEHEEYLKPIETRTRQLLIDPMLEALGWDVRDPAQVHLEYKGTSGKPDYALFSHGNVVALIEAKKLEIPLARIKVEQVIRYARDKALTSLKYVVWTNGDHWQIWSIEEDREESFQLSNTQEYECALKAMQLLRSELEVQEQDTDSPPLRPTPEPTQTQPPIDPSDAGTREIPREATTPAPSSGQIADDPSNSGDWEPLTSLKIETGQQPPARIKFPNSSPKPIKSWVDLWVSVVEHLIETVKVSEKDCPVHRKDDPNDYLLHTEPVHKDGTPFRKDKKKEIGKLWLNLYNVRNVQKYHCWLLDKFGVNPSTVLVSTNPS